ncbi:MAG: hypothetical protein AUJ55_07580 [Proteobacteria bacterium CG1_02_64_396]|nr:MAG: hypothetical protein AUJ55_07580 [Proteobacteria bacterium CG1_02_64_396]
MRWSWVLPFLMSVALPVGADGGGIAPMEAVETHRVVEVLDGDTVVLDNRVHVRVLGINTPEIAHRDQEAMPFGDEAAELTRRWVLGKQVGLAFDHERHDRYGRLLAHVILPDGESLGRRLVASGVAWVYIIPPNTADTEVLLHLEDQARSLGRGLWRLPDYRPLPFQRAERGMGAFRLVTGVVREVVPGRGGVLLKFGERFTVFIAKSDLWRWQERGIDLERQYLGRRVMVRGRIKDYGGPSIRIDDPLQIQRLDRDQSGAVSPHSWGLSPHCLPMPMATSLQISLSEG